VFVVKPKRLLKKLGALSRAFGIRPSKSRTGLFGGAERSDCIGDAVNVRSTEVLNLVKERELSIRIATLSSYERF
jgi:hypothetical protein